MQLSLHSHSRLCHPPVPHISALHPIRSQTRLPVDTFIYVTFTIAAGLCIGLPQVASTDGNDGTIYWSSDKKMPAIVGAETPQVIKQLVAGLDLDIAASDTQFAVHTGGPAILKGTQAALGLSDDQMQVNAQVHPCCVHCRAAFHYLPTLLSTLVYAVHSTH